MGSAETQGELWGQVSSDWALLQEPTSIPLFKAMLDAASVGEGTRFFDVGCGGGSASVIAARRDAQVSGLDAAEGLIKIASERVPSGDFRVGDIEDLPFENDTFDAVIAANSVQFSENPVAALRELGRVCTSEGRVVVGLFGSPEKVAFRFILKAIREVMTEPPPGGDPFGLSAPGKLEGLIEEAELTVIESGEVNCPFSYPDFETAWRGIASAGPFRIVMRTVGEEKLRGVVRQAVESFRADDGRIDIAPNFFKYVVAIL